MRSLRLPLGSGRRGLSSWDAEKGPSEKHGSHPTILAWWYASETCRTSLSLIGCKEKHIMLYDRIALEKHFYVATRAERTQNSKHWILTLNKKDLSNHSINDLTLLEQK